MELLPLDVHNTRALHFLFSLYFNGHVAIFQVNLSSLVPGHVSILDFIGAKCDGGGDDNWSYRAKLESNQHQQTNIQFFTYRPRLSLLSVTQSTCLRNDLQNTVEWDVKLITIPYHTQSTCQSTEGINCGRSPSRNTRFSTPAGTLHTQLQFLCNPPDSRSSFHAVLYS